MSEPAKKCDSSPESYSPKVKPAIITIAETAAERASDSQTYSVKTADNGRYIDGVPMLNWGEWKDNTYCGAIALAAAVVAFRSAMKSDGCIRPLLSVCYEAELVSRFGVGSERNGMG